MVAVAVVLLVCLAAVPTQSYVSMELAGSVDMRGDNRPISRLHTAFRHFGIPQPIISKAAEEENNKFAKNGFSVHSAEAS